jgi:hypothetical protein
VRVFGTLLPGWKLPANYLHDITHGAFSNDNKRVIPI